MITSSLASREKSKLVTSMNQPLLFDSGNQSMVSHDIILSKNKYEISEKESIDLSNNQIKSYFEEQIEKSIYSLSRFPDNPYVLNNIASVYFNQGDYIKAEQYYNKALDNNDKFYPALVGIGKLFVRTGMHDKAVDVYTKTLLYYKNDITVMLNLAHTYLLKRDIYKALNILTDVIKIDQ